MKRKFALCLDWCDTMIEGKILKTMDGACLTPELTEVTVARYEVMLPKLEDGIITEQESKDWFEFTFKCWARAGLTVQKMHECFADFPLREGVRELLTWAREAGLPVSIISGSCREIIEFLLTKNGLIDHVDEIHAPRLIIKDGRVTGVVLESRVDVYTKGRFARDFADKHGVHHEHLIGIGDSHNDRLLAAGTGQLFGLASDHEHAEKIEPVFHHVVIDRTLHPVLELVRRHVGR